MRRPPHALVSFVLLLGTLLGLLPGAQPVPSATAATTPARLSIEPHDPAPQIPRPTQAHSTHLPETYVNTTRQQFGATHTLTNFFDGSFNNPLVPTFSPGTTY